MKSSKPSNPEIDALLEKVREIQSDFKEFQQKHTCEFTSASQITAGLRVAEDILQYWQFWGESE